MKQFKTKPLPVDKPSPPKTYPKTKADTMVRAPKVQLPPGAKAAPKPKPVKGVVADAYLQQETPRPRKTHSVDGFDEPVKKK